MSFSEFVRKRREQLGKSQAELARTSGLWREQVANIERDPSIRRMNPETLAGLAKGLEIPLDSILEAAGYRPAGARQ